MGGTGDTVLKLNIHIKKNYENQFFSSLEPKAEMRKSDQNLSVVRWHSRRYHCRKPFKISSSSPEPLGQVQLYLAQSILGERAFEFFSNEGRGLFESVQTNLM